MRATLILADYAAVMDGKLTVIGGGWRNCSPDTTPSAVGVVIHAPWSYESRTIEVLLELMDADGYPFIVGGIPAQVRATIDVIPEAGEVKGADLNIPFACQISPLPLNPDTQYEWRLSLNGVASDDWRLTFNTRSA